MHFPAQANEPAMDICTNQTPMPSQTNRNARTGRKRKKDVFSGQRTRTGAIFKRRLGLEGRKREKNDALAAHNSLLPPTHGQSKNPPHYSSFPGRKRKEWDENGPH